MQQIKTLLALTTLEGAYDLEKKCKLEQGTIWNWTDSTLPSTAPEKFLDIFYYYHFLIKKFKSFITPLIFIFKTYYYLAKKAPIFKANFIFFIIFVILKKYCIFESLTSTLDF